MIDRPDILYLVHRVPYPPDKGDRIRNLHVLKLLSGRARVHLACLADEPVHPETFSSLKQYCERLAVVSLRPYLRWVRAASSLLRGGTASEGAFYSRRMSATLAAWAQQTHFQSALVSASSMVPYLDSQELRDIPTVVDLIDVDSQKWLDYGAASRGPKAWLYRVEGSRLRRLEQSLPNRMQAVTLVSEVEVELFRQFHSEGAVYAIPIGVDLEYFRPRSTPDTERSTLNAQGSTIPDSCVFVGALDYRPNVDGACWFCSEVWPEILRRRPQAKLLLVGRRPVPAVERLARHPGVELIGQVPDVRPYLARASVVVAPLRLARGVQNKVLEALAMGKAVLASPQSLQGLRVVPGTHLLSATTADEWIASTLRLFDDRALRDQLGFAGREFVQENHHWSQCLEPFAPLLGLASRHKSSASLFNRNADGVRGCSPASAPLPDEVAVRHA